MAIFCVRTHTTMVTKLKAYFIGSTKGNFQLLVHKDIKWLTCDTILNLDWAEANLPIVHKLISIDREI